MRKFHIFTQVNDMEPIFVLTEFNPSFHADDFFQNRQIVCNGYAL